jgi:hypothetical protein
MYFPILDWEFCPDGVELASATDPVYRYRSDKRTAVRYELINLETPIALAFANARTDADRVAFFSRYGLIVRPTKHVWHYTQLGPERDWWPPLSAEKVYLEHSLIQALITTIGRIDSKDTGAAIVTAENALARVSLTPTLDHRQGHPRLAVKVNSLFDFMLMEVALIGVEGARCSSCARCGTMFVTGPKTGRRSSAVYCSDRCRVAAMRQRQRVAGNHRASL